MAELGCVTQQVAEQACLQMEQQLTQARALEAQHVRRLSVINSLTRLFHSFIKHHSSINPFFLLSSVTI